MKSSPDFQTGSILLLTATLVCIGLAIAVIAPIIDSPLAGSTLANIDAKGKTETKSKQNGHPLGEFYPPIARAKYELNRSRQMTGPTVHQASQQSLPLPTSDSAALTEAPTVASLKASTSASREASPAAAFPANFPAGTVYAPITIHQPASTNASSGREIADVAERIERLVTERERLAAAVESEKKRQSEIARRTRRQQAAELQQLQIARLEQELKLLNQSMTNLQSETSTQFSRLTEQNSQIDVASQAINAYREALRVANAESARLADRPQFRTAEATPADDSQQIKDDAGRVNIPVLPPIPSYKPSQPKLLKPAEQAPQRAEAPVKRLRVSSPVRTFQAAPPEPKRRFIPLPTASEKTPEASKPSSTETLKTMSSTFNRLPTQQMKLIPLAAPTIREYSNDRLANSNRLISSTRSGQRIQKPSRAVTPPQTAVLPDLNVGFEHTYQFDSIPIVQDAAEEDVTEIIISTINIDVPQQAIQKRSETVSREPAFQFEAIEFPDLSIIINSNQSATPKPLGELTDLSPVAVEQKTFSRQLQPALAAPLKTKPRQQIADRPNRRSQQPQQKSGLQKVSGALALPKATANSPATNQTETAPKTNLGGRGQNRHLSRKPSEKGRLKVPVFSLERRVADAKNSAPNPSTSKSPSMLQRISHTVRSVGNRPE